MRFLSIIITLAIIGYMMSTYLASDKLISADPEKTMSKPKEFIDHSSQAVDQINENFQKQQKKLEDLN